MERGDMIVLEPATNSTCAHCVLYGEHQTGRRVSLALRHVSRHEMRLLAGDAAAPWRVRARKPCGVWSPWESKPKQQTDSATSESTRQRS